MIPDNLNWDSTTGLLPAIIQDASSMQILMLGYMNREALEKTCETGLVTFFSRSKNRLWTKGESSGNTLQLVRIAADCDQDSLLIFAKPAGPTCHLNQTSCFGNEDVSQQDILVKLNNIIGTRYLDRPENSYTSKLFNQGMARIAQKVGEEGLELALASVCGTKPEIQNEAADLLYHLLVLLRASDVEWMDVLLELQRRHGSAKEHVI